MPRGTLPSLELGKIAERHFAESLDQDCRRTAEWHLSRLQPEAAYVSPDLHLQACTRREVSSVCIALASVAPFPPRASWFRPASRGGHTPPRHPKYSRTFIIEEKLFYFRGFTYELEICSSFKNLGCGASIRSQSISPSKSLYPGSMLVHALDRAEAYAAVSECRAALHWGAPGRITMRAAAAG